MLISKRIILTPLDYKTIAEMLDINNGTQCIVIDNIPLKVHVENGNVIQIERGSKVLEDFTIDFDKNLLNDIIRQKNGLECEESIRRMKKEVTKILISNDSIDEKTKQILKLITTEVILSYKTWKDEWVKGIKNYRLIEQVLERYYRNL